MTRRIEVCQVCSVSEEYHDDHLSGHPYVAPSVTLMEFIAWSGIVLSMIGVLIILGAALGWLRL